jgi:hypothetical protein
VLCDAFIVLYILVITLYLLLAGLNLTTNIVTSALLTYVTKRNHRRLTAPLTSATITNLRLKSFTG